MKQITAFSLFAVALAFVLPLLLYLPGRGGAAAEEAGEPAAMPAAESAPVPAPGQAEPEPVRDAEITLAVLTEDGVVQMTMADYLPAALAGEMPASFSPEALKAQAVALRTYALYYQFRRKDAHPEADVCCRSGCCAALAQPDTLREAWGDGYDAYAKKLAEAVRATDGQYLVWEEAPALTVFHASSAGRTEDGAALGIHQRYLVSVDTPETAEAVRNLLSTVEVSAEEFAAAVHSVLPEAALSGAPETWLGPVHLDAAGRVQSAEIGGQDLSGLALRQLFSLRSTDFTLAYTDGRFVFRVRGYGHGLGMSQYGAECMARDGADYTEILSHYYPGTALVMAVRTE
jgi:stage II sporulation protein D